MSVTLEQATALSNMLHAYEERDTYIENISARLDRAWFKLILAIETKNMPDVELHYNECLLLMKKHGIPTE